jgi:hypothetical protein
MPGTTPIYGFPYPEPSDLVANYPALGQQLAEDVETEISGLGSGLVHLNTTTVSAQTTVNFNNVFSATYSVYQIFAVLTTGGDAISFTLRMRLSGTDNTTSNYRYQVVNGQTSPGASSTTSTGFDGLTMDNDFPNVRNITFIDPQAARVTGYTDLAYAGYTLGQGGRITGIHNVATAYDGFSMTGSSAFSGTVYVYGMVAA